MTDVLRYPNGPDNPPLPDEVKITYRAGNGSLIQWICSDCGPTFSGPREDAIKRSHFHGEQAHLGEKVTYGPLPGSIR